MRVLITAASRHGSTAEIAGEIGRVLGESGIGVDVEPMDEVDGLARYSAVIVGSAVYAGRWLPPALEFIERHEAELAARPVWLFSSGPLGSPDPKPTTGPQDVTELAVTIGARSHTIFSGKIDRDQLSLGERTIVRLVRAPEGDFREWATIDAWATEIAAELKSLKSAAGVRG